MTAICIQNKCGHDDIIKGEKYNIRSRIRNDTLFIFVTFNDGTCDIICYDSLEEFMEEWKVENDG